MPYWAQVTVIPLLNIFVALALAGCVVLLLGENPFKAMAVMLQGAFVYPGGLGFTLYYTTNLIFTGLCVAMAFHAMQFNIGGEGQAIIGGLGVALFLLFVGDSLPLIICLPLAVLAAAAAGGAWAFIPGYLYAKRGSHIVITTIMFNFIAAAVLQYLLVNVLIAPGQMSPQSVKFAERTHLPQIHELLALVGIETESTPLNISLFLALAAAVGFWFLIWRTSWGYALRTVGQSERAAVYAGIDPARMTVQAMAISGALAGMVGVNALMGDAHRILLGFATGYGFAGIGVALMGRNHPLGIVLAAALFGILTQGGSELNFEFRNITRDLVIVIQGLIILMVGALSLMLDPPVARLIALVSRRKEET
ncbi:MAG: ABC transporter permease [Betaproteobacteria bacterium AqS2]|uniref:ABC transporter permease n=1 Tax=Candidatus Amphirhobacter heronislandensis TaxID=1732024 RepID=A0A930UCD8_9GAMM|nr:ABC transporter permease [Betaproteobacteria bacterium AqS2]